MSNKGKMTDEQKQKMAEGRAKAKAAAAAAAANAPAGTAPAGQPLTFKPRKTPAKPIAKAYIPKGTPVAGVQSTLNECVELAKAQGVVVTRVAGTLRLY